MEQRVGELVELSSEWRVVLGSPKYVVTGIQARESTWRLETAPGVLAFVCARVRVTFVTLVPSKLEQPRWVGLACESHPTAIGLTRPPACEQLPVSQ